LVLLKDKSIFLILQIIAFSCQYAGAQSAHNTVTIVGQMKDVMRKGQLYGNIHLDTISNRSHLYGMGPVAFLRGEILVIDGKSYKASIDEASKLKVEESYNIKAPFFGYANIEKWVEHTFPDSVQTMQQLETYLDKITKKNQRPFMFKLTGKVAEAKIHVQNLPVGTEVKSPEDARKGQQTYTIKNKPADIVGFFSREHQTIFTHHNTFLHMHLITKDRTKMGHLDALHFRKKRMKLYLPAE
jgi:acetolactate decarboxylase